MAKLRKIALIALLSGVFSIAGAQTLDMQGTAPGVSSGGPTRGMTQASVESKYGSPVSKVAAVGEPPISRWVYANMIVYFEHDRVIHAVKTK